MALPDTPWLLSKTDSARGSRKVAERIFLGIGVAKPRGMTPLPGVENSVGAMAAWATKQGYAASTITDKQVPVSADRIRAKLEESLQAADFVDRIVVYFGGHGFLEAPDQIWILSDGPSVNTGRISRNTLRASIQTYRPKQIGIIADACLEARYFASGSVSVLDDKPGSQRRVFVDSIFSTSPNLPSYNFVSDTEGKDFCLFTSVLLAFLTGRDPRAFRLANGTSIDVTTQTLYFNLPDAVIERAAELGVLQEPQMDPGFPVGEDVYSRFDLASSGDRTGPSPPTSGSSSPPTDPREPGDTEAPGYASRSTLDLRLSDERSLPPPLLAEKEIERLQVAATEWDERLAALVLHAGPRASWGVIVNEQPTGFFEGPIADPASDGWWLPILFSDLDKPVAYVGRQRRRFLTLSWETESERSSESSFFTMVPIYEGLIATVHLSNDLDYERKATGCVQLSWSPEYTSYRYSEKTHRAWRALTALVHGKLASADSAAFADDLRDEKHANPMIGVVCAYLYDLVGDTDSIARLCHFYVQHGQGIPFDIALLSGGRLTRSEEKPGWELQYAGAREDKRRRNLGVPEYLWRATRKGTGIVAGAAPLVRPGWHRLASRQDSALRELAMLADSLTQAPIATLVGETAISRCRAVLEDLQLL